jgi:hypothetical protein
MNDATVCSKVKEKNRLRQRITLQNDAAGGGSESGFLSGWGRRLGAHGCDA